MSARSNPSGQWLDPAAAAVPAAAAAWSATLIGPLIDVPAALASALAGLAMFGAGWAVMRGTAPRPAPFALRTFQPPAEPDELLLDRVAEGAAEADILLLDRPLADSIDALAELLLDDPLVAPRADSRVVQLFPAQPMPTAGQLKRRIDVHLGLQADSDGSPNAGADATDSLRRALDELRQTLTPR